MRKYQVFHVTDDVEIHVSDVEVAETENINDELEAVYHSTNHIDKNWLLNENVIPFVHVARSSMVNDIFVSPEGNRYTVDYFGFIREE